MCFVCFNFHCYVCTSTHAPPPPSPALFFLPFLAFHENFEKPSSNSMSSACQRQPPPKKNSGLHHVPVGVHVPAVGVPAPAAAVHPGVHCDDGGDHQRCYDHRGGVQASHRWPRALLGMCAVCVRGFGVLGCIVCCCMLLLGCMCVCMCRY